MPRTERRHFYIIGIDEVGRGPLAGPVVVAAAAYRAGTRILQKSFPAPLRDSKKLKEEDRERWVRYLKTRDDIHFAVARVFPKMIDRMNIARAANRAATNAFIRLCVTQGIAPSSAKVVLDGGLYLEVRARAPHAKTVVKGDERFTAIKFASIFAKVVRDQGMKQLAKKYPGYGFEIHKGYGTKRHKAALKKLGPSEAHRMTFLRG